MAPLTDTLPPRQGTAAERRLSALRATGLLDAPAEERFDRLTRLARRLLRAPVALVALVDADRQFFLSAQGLPEPWASLREMPLSRSLCRFVVETGLPLSVGDAREDPRVAGHPAVAELGVAAYLAAPLSSPDGQVIGAFCAIDWVPRAWSAEDAQALSDLAGAATTEVAAGPRLREREAAEARLREMQAKLLHVCRVSAAGEVASALAHELDQPLTAATSAIGAARRMLAASLCSPDGGRQGAAGEVGVALDLAAEQVLRAGHIVRRLRGFVARGEADKRPADLRKLVEDAGSLALAGAKERGVRATVRFAEALPPVFVDAIQVQQVLFNLMRNALEAMAAEAPGGEGARTRRRDLSVSAAPSRPGAVEVAVADSGPGVAPEVAGRLFEAFVSTKPGGMGVGLSICRSIVEAHGGRLWAEPNPAGGAVFRFTLPVAPPPEAGACQGGEKERRWQPTTNAPRRRRPERHGAATAAP